MIRIGYAYMVNTVAFALLLIGLGFALLRFHAAHPPHMDRSDMDDLLKNFVMPSELSSVQIPRKVHLTTYGLFWISVLAFAWLGTCVFWLKLHYDMTDTGQNQLASDCEIGVIPLLASVICGALLYNFIQAWKLLKFGTATGAVVTRADISNNGRAIHYDFYDRTRGIISGRIGASSPLPSIRSIIVVIYNPVRPKRNIIYPYDALRLGTKVN